MKRQLSKGWKDGNALNMILFQRPFFIKALLMTTDRPKLMKRFHDHWLPLSDEDEEGVWRHYETGEVRSFSLTLSSHLYLSLSSFLSLSSSFLCNRPSENLKPHQRWQRSRTGVLDNQTGERFRTAPASESSTATGWTYILPPISYFTIFSIVQY